MKPTITVIYPADEDTLYQGTDYTIKWTSTGNVGNVQIHLYRPDGTTVTLAANDPNDGEYPFNVPINYPSIQPGTGYKIGISKAPDGDPSNFSGSFTIQGFQTGMKITAQPGWTIFSPSESCGITPNSEYRYGPSIIINRDNSIDVWFSSPGNGGGQWDWIRYNRSTDGGLNWLYSWEPHTNPNKPDVVLFPSDPPSRDQYSCCDPGVIKFNGYYYIGYTSAGNNQGRCNSVFVARSLSPSGPFQKWNGSGWGGEDPQPFIKCLCENQDEWGASEPSFVVKDETLYIYYEWTKVGTKVATASIHDPNWPKNITFYDKPAIPKVPDEISSREVKYIDALGLFVAVAVRNRFLDNSSIHVWESIDGFSFISADEIRENLVPKAHNVGISGTPEGHIDLNLNNFIAYAYGSPPLPNVPECWPTYLNPISIHSSAYCSLSTSVSQPGAGSITKNPDKTNYTYNESV